MNQNIAAPRLRFVVLCQNVSEDSNGSLNLLGLLSRVTATLPSQNMPPPSIPIKAVIAIYSEDVEQTYFLRFTLKYPDGSEEDAGDEPFGKISEGYIPIRIANVILRVASPGLYWFRVWWGDELLGEAPIEFHYKIR